MMTETARLDALVRLLQDQAKEIADKGHNGWGNTMIDAASEIERLRVGHDRYETVRKLNPRQLADIHSVNISTGKPFDEIIDNLRPFVRPNAI